MIGVSHIIKLFLYFSTNKIAKILAGVVVDLARVTLEYLNNNNNNNSPQIREKEFNEPV